MVFQVFVVVIFGGLCSFLRSRGCQNRSGRSVRTSSDQFSSKSDHGRPKYKQKTNRVTEKRQIPKEEEKVLPEGWKLKCLPRQILLELPSNHFQNLPRVGSNMFLMGFNRFLIDRRTDRQRIVQTSTNRYLAIAR